MNHASDSKPSSIAADTPDPGYKPPPEFQEVEKDPLVGISMTDSTELWLIQWPVKQLQLDDLKGKELSLKLQDNGKLASLESSGKSFDVVSFASQQPDAAVFMASRSQSKIVGKISRRVCLIHYPEPSELEKPGRPGLSRQRSPGSSLRVRSGASSVVQMQGSLEMRNKVQGSSEMRNKMQGSSEMRNEFSPGTTTPTHSSKRKSSLSSASSVKEQKRSKQQSVDDSQLLEQFTKFADRSTQDSGWQSAPASSGHPDDTREGESKKKKKKSKVDA